MSGRIPASAKREALRKYRWYRQFGCYTLRQTSGHAKPFDAIDAVVNKYAIELADAVAAGNDTKIAIWLPRYRAARYYLNRLGERRWASSLRTAERLADEARHNREIAADLRRAADLMEAGR